MIDPDFLDEPSKLDLRSRLRDPRPLLCVELRPPRRDLEGVRAMEAWIDVYHAVRGLASRDTVVFLTDDAVGTGEEENLAHLLRNLGDDSRRERIVPFLTLKHSLDYCLNYAARLSAERFPGVVVLGGDRHDGIPRCLPHAWQLREKIAERQPALQIGGWANPHRDPDEQAGYLADHGESLSFVITQVVSHHDLAPVEAFLEALDRRGVDLPLIAGVFYYRSARRRTLDLLEGFIPVPREGLEREFAEGAGADVVAARTLRALAGLGIDRYYLSNLPGSASPRGSTI
ncbi:MAG: hypothetical protein Q9Q13_13120 [Acidobacteriota bacterium]|nr:hypothetical protein [Acidobacteriota bacterium]